VLKEAGGKLVSCSACGRIAALLQTSAADTHPNTNRQRHESTPDHKLLLTLGGLPGFVSLAGDVLRSPTSTVARAPLTYSSGRRSSSSGRSSKWMFSSSSNSILQLSMQ
jgi:hypothetical protein